MAYFAIIKASLEHNLDIPSEKIVIFSFSSVYSPNQVVNKVVYYRKS